MASPHTACASDADCPAFHGRIGTVRALSRDVVLVVAAYVSACSDTDKLIENPTDPRTCPVAPGPAVGDTCTVEGQSCHYRGGGCGPNWVCSDSRWQDTGGRFSCGDCASDVRCSPGDSCQVADATCGCEADGVFACAHTGVVVINLPACPIVDPSAEACTADGQVCHYFAGTCALTCECTSSVWSCTDACGA